MLETLKGHDPEATDRLVAISLPPSIASALVPLIEEIVDPTYGWDYRITGYTLNADNPSDLGAARMLIAAALVPAELSVIRPELARLRVSTKSRELAADELAMTMQVMAEECALWPPDVVRAALRRWARRETWFPSLAELRDELQRAGRHRKALAHALGAP